MTQGELNKILKDHKLWLDSNMTKGKQADLSNIDLRLLKFCDLDLHWVNLIKADLRCVYLNDANLSCAILCGANLSYADLRYADLVGADLSGANLSYANLCDANLYSADLSGANLWNATLDKEEQIRKGIILQEKMIGWKKCQDDVLVKLEIPKGAVVFSINNNKCRTNIAKVIEIIGGDGNSAISQYDENFIYRLNKVVKVKDFDFQYYNVECAPGIHFFKTQEEAIAY